MESDDLLCSRSARPPKDGEGAKGSATPLPLGVVDSVGGVKSVCAGYDQAALSV